MKKKKRSKRYNHMIRKNSKDFEFFNEFKFKKSLRRSGVSVKDSDEIIAELGDLKNYFSTKELHNATYKVILKRSKLYAANYNIKRAIFNLGPTGYPFEQLCAQMLEAKGYKTRVSVMKKGEFVRHEIDVVAKRADSDLYCECKYHSKSYHKNDIKIPLYVQSRYLDIKKANPNENFNFAIISNTPFSKDAIKYATGVGLSLYSLNYPVKNTFCDLIRKYKVYPITVLKSLKVSERRKLLEKGVVVIKQVNEQHLTDLGLSKNQIIKVFQEINVLKKN